MLFLIRGAVLVSRLSKENYKEELTYTAEPSQVIVDRLFPDRDTETLLSLSREQLISLLTSPGLSSSDLEPSSLQTRLQNGPEVEGERTTKRRRLSIDHEHPEQSAATDDFEPGPGRVIQPPNLWLQDSAMASTQSFELGGLQNDLNDGTQHGLQAVQTGKGKQIERIWADEGS